jgi:NADH-quinone oxidoreductase subunit M
LGTLEFSKLGGLAGNAPFLTVIFGFATFASIGLPGLANFAGEFMVFAGSFSSDIRDGFKPIHWAVIAGLWGVVMSAVYMLRAYRHLFFGKAAAGHFVTDPAKGQRLPLLILTAVLLVVGICPSLITDLLSNLAGK